MKSVDLVVVGNLLLDDLPHGANVPGGAALFTALAARCHGLTVAVHSVVGNDYPVHWLEEAGIELSLLRLDGPGGRTVIRYLPEGRTLRHVGPCHRELSPQVRHPYQAAMVHIAPMPTDIQAFHLAQAGSRGALLDPYPLLDHQAWQSFRPHRAHLAALLLNAEELALEIEDLDSDVWLILKQAEHGGVTFHPSLSWSAMETEVTDFTGAGDSFAGGLAAALIAGKPRMEALRVAAETATWALQSIGAEGLYQRALQLRKDPS